MSVKAVLRGRDNRKRNAQRARGGGGGGARRQRDAPRLNEHPSTRSDRACGGRRPPPGRCRSSRSLPARPHACASTRPPPRPPSRFRTQLDPSVRGKRATTKGALAPWRAVRRSGGGGSAEWSVNGSTVVQAPALWNRRTRSVTAALVRPRPDGVSQGWLSKGFRDLGRIRALRYAVWSSAAPK